MKEFEGKLRTICIILWVRASKYAAEASINSGGVSIPSARLRVANRVWRRGIWNKAVRIREKEREKKKGIG